MTSVIHTGMDFGDFCIKMNDDKSKDLNESLYEYFGEYKKYLKKELIDLGDGGMFNIPSPQNAYTFALAIGFIPYETEDNFNYPINEEQCKILGDMSCKKDLSEKYIKSALVYQDIKSWCHDEKVLNTINFAFDSMDLKTLNKIWGLPGEK